MDQNVARQQYLDLALEYLKEQNISTEDPQKQKIEQAYSDCLKNWNQGESESVEQ